MSAIEAVVFDMDGVLVDSEPLWHDAELLCFREVGVPLAREDCLQTTGLRIDEVVRHWHARHPWSGASQGEVARRIVERMVALVGERAEPKPGAVDAVRLARARVGKVGLASSSPRVLIDAVLRRLGIEGAFAVVCSAEVEPHGKPHPAVYLTAARLLSAAPAACVAVEDSRNGILSALAAGMRVVAVPDVPVDAAVLDRAAVVLRSLEELPARWNDVVGPSAV